MKVTFTEFRLEDYLDNEEIRKEYLNQVLADGDTEELKRALFYIAKSRGIESVAKKANLNRESFYKMFKPIQLCIIRDFFFPNCRALLYPF